MLVLFWMITVCTAGGLNNNGQIGNGNTNDVSIPTKILDSTHQVVGVAAGEYTTCAWLRNGSAMCWGVNTYGQIGNGNTTQMLNPTWVNQHTLNSEINIVTMDIESHQACALYMTTNSIMLGYG